MSGQLLSGGNIVRTSVLTVFMYFQQKTGALRYTIASVGINCFYACLPKCMTAIQRLILSNLHSTMKYNTGSFQFKYFSKLLFNSFVSKDRSLID